MVIRGNGYKNLWAKVKSRDNKIIKLKDDILSLKAYVKKVQNRSIQRKVRAESYLERARVEREKNKEFERFISQPFEKRAYNLLDYTTKFYRSFSQVGSVVNIRQLMILIYLKNVGTASTSKIKKELGLTETSAKIDMWYLISHQLIISNKISRLRNYAYLTEEGKKAVKTFLDLMTKAKGIIE